MTEQTIKGGAPGAKQGFIPSHLAAPALRDSRTTALEYVAGGLGDIRLSAAIMDGPLAAKIEAEATRLQRLVKALASGALVAAFLAAGLVVAGPSAGRAEAAEGPQPDPVAAVASQTVRVTLGAAPVTVWVRASVYTEKAPGWFCGSVWSARGKIGATCSIGSTFPVPIVVDPRTFPVGRTFAQVVDDASDVAVSNVTIDARRPSRFGVGTWTPTQYGDGLTVSARLYAYTPALGRWTPQQASPVKVQELRAGRWVTIAAGTTNRSGRFLITFITGGGPHTLRVHRDTGATVAAVNGTARHFYLYPTDVPDGTV